MIREAGDSALILQVGTTVDPVVNARAIAIAAAVRDRGIEGVRDVVPTFHSVTVFFDPLTTDVAAVSAALEESRESTSVEEARNVIEIQVSYGGEAGPDLADIAAVANLTPEEVIERHAARTYRVYMLGFLPGYPYLGTLDPAIAVPRRATPRLRVPAGSVAVAGLQTGIYPFDSPGGWQIIGRTPVQLFDPARSSPALLAPGDSVRFVPVSETDVERAFTARLARRKAAPYGNDGIDDSTRYVNVLTPGLLTTVQDAGRWRYQALGVPVSGPMDPASHARANSLVGNPPDAAALEATLLGPELRFDQDTRVAVAGADLRPMLEERDLPMDAACDCPAGSVLRFAGRRSGARAYIAFDGGIAVTPVLGSRATHLLSGLGGFEGRALKAGDRIPLAAHKRTDAGADLSASAKATADAPKREQREGGQVGPDVIPRGGARLRVLLGPQSGFFDAAGFEVLQRNRYTVSSQSDRMGYRLDGPPIRIAAADEMISDATFTGGLQVTSSGQPIVLMADRQTTGGYPQIAVIIAADLPLAAQLAPGDWVEFEMCSRSDAIAALREREGQGRAVR